MGPGSGHDDPVDGPPGTSCSEVRELISADADDALGADDAQVLELHLEGCHACAAYRSRIADLSRSTRVRSATFDPAFVATVMQRAQPARLGRGGWLRPALAWCGLLVAVQSVSPLVFGEIEGAPTHVARHVGASTFALGVGLLYVAWRPHRAFGVLPLVSALFAAMLAGAFFDVVGGDRSAMSEMVHVVELVGMVLLWMVAGSPGWDRVERVFRFRRRGREVARTTS
ncbi:zf-HC2 domain-containing protein [Ilumatobacter sp.]|uniref:zf-HC2 domain-containing protein n=1 Tax=Ilumatobacter sp. TaxID=1967498 RepID=UPI003AF8A6F5